MSDFDADRLPEEFDLLEARLRERKPEVTALQLDQIKLRAKARAAGRPTRTWRGTASMKTRNLITTALVACCALAGAGATYALSTQFSSTKSASETQYGNKCDKEKTPQGKRRCLAREKCKNEKTAQGRRRCEAREYCKSERTEQGRKKCEERELGTPPPNQQARSASESGGASPGDSAAQPGPSPAATAPPGQASGEGTNPAVDGQPQSGVPAIRRSTPAQSRKKQRACKKRAKHHRASAGRRAQKRC